MDGVNDVNRESQSTTYRELKTVLFADVAEYSRLVESNEDLTHLNLCTRFSLISNLIRHHNGVIHRTEGDSVLATFSAATSALQCAIDIQSASCEQNNNLGSGNNLSFRIGINCGEVLIDNGEAYGNCVNVAKRLESLAKPGEIIFSETYFDHVHRTLPYNYKYLGKHHLKNLKQKVKVYSLANHSKPSTAAFTSRISFTLNDSFLPVSALATAVFFSFFIAYYLDFNHYLVEENNLPVYLDNTVQSSNRAEFISHYGNSFHTANENIIHVDNINKDVISEPTADFETYEVIQNELIGKYEEQNKLLSSFEKQNNKLLSQQKVMAENFLRIEKELATKKELVDSYSTKNNILIEANKTLLTKLDEVVSHQTLSTFENLYAEYKPVRQQIIDIIELQPEAPESEDDKLNCSIYSNEAVQPHALDGSKGAVREELHCVETKNEHAPIPQSQLSHPTRYKKELSPKEKKLVIYAYVPTPPHQTSVTTKSINKSIVELYKKALSNSSLQSYKTNFILLSPPTSGQNFAELDAEHCNVYDANYVASFRVNNHQSHSSWPESSELVIHNCDTDASSKRNTRYLLSDSWNDNGNLYLTPSTLDSFNVQVNSIVELALNHSPIPELEL